MDTKTVAFVMIKNILRVYDFFSMQMLFWNDQVDKIRESIKAAESFLKMLLQDLETSATATIIKASMTRNKPSWKPPTP